jgi:hydrogenase nickel incorporation protein HypA/HybF
MSRDGLGVSVEHWETAVLFLRHLLYNKTSGRAIPFIPSEVEGYSLLLTPYALTFMHEQSIVENLLSIALDSAKNAKATKIHKINVVVGELSGAVDESMNFYFNFLRQNTIAAEAELVFTRKPAVLHCRKCKLDFTSENMDFRCPKCHQPSVDIIGGRDLYVESLEAE